MFHFFLLNKPKLAIGKNCIFGRCEPYDMYEDSELQIQQKPLQRVLHSEEASKDPTHIQHCEQCRNRYHRREINRLREIKNRKEEELDFLRIETESYEKALRNNLNLPKDPSDPSSDTSQKTLEFQRLNDLKHKVQSIRKQRKYLERFRQRCQDIQEQLSLTQENVQRLQNEVYAKLYLVLGQCSGRERRYQLALLEYQSISKRNAWNDIFYMHIDAEFGRINGVVLGIQNSTDINYDALNYALGDCVLLLHCLSRTIQFKYYRPMPFGRQSYFIDSSKTRFNLHFDKSNWSWRSNVNNGLKALVVCMKEIEMKFQLQGVPGKIDLNKGCINKYSWKFPSNPQKKDQTKCWNKACRYILSNLKVYTHKLSSRM